MTQHIALVEDDNELRENYTEALQREGYVVSAYKNRPEAQDAFSEKLPDLAILDIMLEDERDGGFTLCRFLRSKSESIPIIFLTALDSDIDKVSAMRLNATDYLLKDTTTLVYLPERVSALFRWLKNIKKPIDKESNLIRGPLTLNVDRQEVTWKNFPIRFTVAEFSILHALVKRSGNVKNHDQLMEATGTIVTPNAIAASIKRIRGKFKDVDPEFDCINTVFGMGYRWIEQL